MNLDEHVSVRRHHLPIRKISTSGGLGDVIMSLAGLQALLLAAPEVFPSDAAVYVKSSLRNIAAAMIHGMTVRPATELRRAGPIYATFAKTSWSKALRNVFSRSYYNNFPDRRPWRYGHPRYSLNQRLQRVLTGIALDGRLRWRRETPVYHGLKMWAPLAERVGLAETEFLRMVYRSYRGLRERLRVFCHSLPAPEVPRLAFFSAGRSFQYAPMNFIRQLVDRLGLGSAEYCCYFAPDDMSDRATFEQAGLSCATVSSFDETLALVWRAEVTVTVDSFVGHLAQFVANEHVLLLSRELPEEVVHPAAPSARVFEAMPCVPCVYEFRTKEATCPAGRAYCGVYDSATYLDRAERALRRLLSP